MDKHKLSCEVVSAKSGEHIEEMFHKIIDMINDLQNANKGKKKKFDDYDEVDNPPLTKDPIVEINSNREESEAQGATKLVNEDEKGGKKKSRCCG